MKFGLFGGASATDQNTVTDSSKNYHHFIDYVCEAERLGFHSVFMVEHHFTGFNQISASLNFLSYLAACTNKIRLGTAVTVLPWHNPILLAEQAATLDLLSNGRLDFGVGRGYRYSEFSGFGIPMTEAEDRYKEALSVIRKSWTTMGRFSHQGPHWSYDDIVVEPTPVQKPHPPMWVGAGNLDVIRTLAKDDVRLLLDQLSTPEVSGQRLTAYKESVEQLGRIFNPMDVALARGFLLSMNNNERERHRMNRLQFMKHIRRLSVNPNALASSIAPPATDDEVHKATEKTTLIGSPDEIIKRLKELESLGIEYVLLMDLDVSIDSLKMFAKEVMPAFH